MSPYQKRLFDLVQTSKLLYPKWGIYNAGLVRQHWNALCAIADGSDDIRALPPEMFDGVDIEFALMRDAERIALYQKDPKDCARRTEGYMNQTKRIMCEETQQLQP
jgi:hypothetical protein